MIIGIDANAFYKNNAGSGTYVRNLINAIRKDNAHQIVLFSNKRPVEMDLSKKRNILKRVANGLSEILWMQLSLPMSLAAKKVDTLLCPSSIGPILAPCPVVMTIYDMAYLRHPETCDKLFRTYLKLLLLLVKGRIERIITISEFSKKEISELLGIPLEKIRVIYPGCNESFKVIEDRRIIGNIMEKYEITDRFIFNVGTLEPRKNIVALISAFDILKKKHSISHKLVLSGGKGWYYEDIFKKVSEFGLEEEVIFTGFVTEQDLPVLYNAADVFVFPSLYEGFGMPVLEAMSCGCPVVVSMKASLPEVVGDAGALVNPHDPSQIAEAMLSVISNSGIRNEMVEKGLRRAKTFSWEHAAKETLEVLTTCVN